MAFHDIRISDDIERGARGGPGFKTTIISVGGGFEQRNQEWSLARGQWDFSYGISNKDTYEEFLKFFYVRRGRLHGFRFKDWSDFEQLTQVTFGTGDNATTDFQLIKEYTDAAGTYTRKITRPVDATIQIFDNAVLQTITVDYTIDALGIISFVVAPASMADLTWTGEFDVPVRFDVDDHALDVIWYDAASVPELRVVELRE